ncbi:Enoyl-CoA hydratase/isomerase [Sphingobium chlorophenolicum L-1]|uniref:Enoyl-CoA hydratase/isomerase n=1 Tax=Sphingobium chlorophenolicum L-1 TaxID=690566 RepID=F6EUH7_SPHCR|nr:enoyl-CoA hydratase/isomerase family protein [Sphingobium chlorophenolicum]AEG47871.1 Enoyl-CoA hydratase/isomerase [Sphingobium chlorophenolicum L-1]
MAKFGTMRSEVKDGVATVYLDRPDKKNALSTELFEDLVETLSAWRQDDSVAAVVITGTEDYFSAGLDLDTMNWASEADRLRWYDATYYGYLELLEYPKPTIAAVAGPTFGGGCDIAVFCDIRVSNPNAKFGFPQVRFGLTPFVDPLQRIVGQSQAKLLVLTGRRIDANEALRIGLIDQIAEQGKLLETAQGIAAEIAATTTQTVVRTTEMLRRSWAMDPMAAYVYGHVQYRDVHWNPEISARMLNARSKVGSGNRNG